MDIKIKEIAGLIDGKIIGNEEILVNNVSKIQEAKAGELTFLYLPAYHKYLSTTNASAVLIAPEFEKTRSDLVYIEVADPNRAFQKIIEEYFTDPVSIKGIDSTAYVDPSAELGENAALGMNVVVSENCRIGEGTQIFHNTVILKNVRIGKGCLIYPNVTIREGCIIGDNVIVHSGAVIGADGFGYNVEKNGVYKKIPQVGNVVIEDDVEIGANTTIDRAVTGSTIIRKGVKLDNLIQIAHNVEVGNDTAISAQSGISGSSKVGRNCVFGGQVGLAGHLEVADKVLIGAQSGVSKSLKKPGTYFGSPALELSHTLRLGSHVRNLPNYVERIKTLEKELSILKETVSNSQKKGDS